MFKFIKSNSNRMSGLENLNKRLSYHGGNAEHRFQRDKLETLKKSLLYSYQAATAILSDGREFRCLINSNKETGDYDTKIISIPYKDICLNSTKKDTTSNGIETIGLKCGDVFTWKETDTHWIVFLEYLEEDSYFRAQIRKCDQEVEINGKKYWTYIRGPVETSIQWNQKGGVEWNDLNYSLSMFIARDENTVTNIKRFAKIKIKEPITNIEKTWQVAAVNPYYGDGIIQCHLEEYFENTLAEAAEKEKAQSIASTSVTTTGSVYITGPKTVPAYSSADFSLNTNASGTWTVTYKNNTYNCGTGKIATIDFNMKKGQAVVKCSVDTNVYTYTVTIEAF